MFRCSWDVLLDFGLYSFPLAFCLLCASVVLQSSITWVAHALNTHRLYWHTFSLLCFLFSWWPWSSVSIFFAVWLLGEWTHYNCEDGVAGVAEPPKSLWRVFYKHGRCFQRIVWNSAVIQVQNLNWSTWSFSRICHIENAGEPWAEEWIWTRCSKDYAIP